MRIIISVFALMFLPLTGQGDVINVPASSTVELADARPATIVTFHRYENTFCRLEVVYRGYGTIKVSISEAGRSRFYPTARPYEMPDGSLVVCDERGKVSIYTGEDVGTARAIIYAWPLQLPEWAAGVDCGDEEKWRRNTGDIAIFDPEMADYLRSAYSKKSPIFVENGEQRAGRRRNRGNAGR